MELSSKRLCSRKVRQKKRECIDQRERTEEKRRKRDSVKKCAVLLEVYRWCDVGFTVCSVEMNVCLKGHHIWRSFGTKQQVVMFGKSATEEEKNVWIKKREKEESDLAVW